MKGEAMANAAAGAALIEKWANQTIKDIEEVYREAVAQTVSDMQMPVGAGGQMPVDTGFLRASIRMSKTGPLPASMANPGKQASYNSGPVLTMIESLKIGESIWASYTANYALHVHYGANGRPGRQWVTLAAQRWPQTVKAAAAKVRAGS